MLSSRVELHQRKNHSDMSVGEKATGPSKMSPHTIVSEARRESNLGGCHTPQMKSHAKPYDMSVQQTVDQTINKHPFGIDNYEPNVKTLPDRVIQVAPREEKRRTFVDTIPQITAFVPGPHYEATENKPWFNRRPRHSIKMSKGPRDTFIDQIVKQSKKPEKSSPSPADYESFKAWQRTNLSHKVVDMTRKKDERTTYFEEKIAIASEIPFGTYNAVNPVSCSYETQSCLIVEA